MSIERGRERLLRILEEIRREEFGEVRPEFVSAVGELEVRNQFAVDRRAARRELRELIDREVRLRMEQTESED